MMSDAEMKGWRKAINESKYTAAAFLDVSKAFDSVNHDVLLSKLACYGVVDNSLLWFASYLSCRWQRVCLQGLTSEWGAIHPGVLFPRDPFWVLYCSELFAICCWRLPNEYVLRRYGATLIIQVVTYFWHNMDNRVIWTLLISGCGLTSWILMWENLMWCWLDLDRKYETVIYRMCWN